MTHHAFIGLGSNLGDSPRQIREALAAIGRIPETRIDACSPLYRSAPVSAIAQPDYVNAVASVWTELSPEALLDALLEIERLAGRVRELKDAPRTLDLDVLLYDEQLLSCEKLQIPHPRMHERRFVLAPLCDIAPKCVIPGLGPARIWLDATSGQQVTKLTETDHAA